MLHSETDQHRALVKRTRRTISRTRPYLVGIGGVDGCGKSSLAWQLDASNIETDLFLDRPAGNFNYRTEELENAIRSRLDPDRLVIVEGIFLLRLLASIDVSCDWLIHVESSKIEDCHAWQ